MDSSIDNAPAVSGRSAAHQPPASASAPAPAPVQLPLPVDPLPPRDDAAKPTQLTELFRDHKAARACQLLQEISMKDMTTEVYAAFNAVEWAPNAFLLALTQWPSNAPRNKFYILIHAAVECMKLRGVPPSPMTSDLAGSLLVDAFSDCRAPLVTAFATVFCISTTHIKQHCTRLFDTQIKHVVTVLDTLNVRSLFPLDVVVEAAIVQNDLDAADAFVKRNPEHQRVYVQTLIERRFHDKMIRKRMAKFRLDERSFPGFYERRMKASLRFLVYNQQYEDILTTVEGEHELGLYACHFILSQRGDDDAIAQLFVHRSGLAQHFTHVNTSALRLAAFPNKDELEPLANCLSIMELAGDDSCVFVDTPAALAECVAHLSEAAVVGFDCEWKTATQGGQTAEACAVMQLASATRAFVIDTIALKGQCQALGDLFLSESVMKLGFDTKQDVSVVAKVLYLDGDSRHQEHVRNLVDVQALAKRLRNLKRPRLDNKRSVEVEDGEVVEDTPAAVAAEQDTIISEDPLETAASDTADKAASKKDRKKKKKNKRASGENGEDDGSNLSLAAVAETYLGKPLDKRSRMSDWERRPLTNAQLTYAALDALVLVAIFEKMKNEFTDEMFNQALIQISRPRNAVQKSKASGKDEST